MTRRRFSLGILAGVGASLLPTLAERRQQAIGTTRLHGASK
jgi:hypothetical protein